MRLKFLLHCVQCHLVLLILVGFSVAGYVLRDELGALVAWPRSAPELAQQSPRDGANDGPGAVGGSAAGSEHAGGGSEVVALHSHPPADRRGESAGRQGLAAADSRLAEGEFRFRPLDDAPPPGAGDAERRDEMLAAARRAYWTHDLPLAVRHYEALIEVFPNDPDFFGELGNIYFEQGQTEQAGQAYYEAGLLLLARGQRTRAREMVDLLQMTSPSYAESLLERLQGTR